MTSVEENQNVAGSPANKMINIEPKQGTTVQRNGCDEKNGTSSTAIDAVADDSPVTVKTSTMIAVSAMPNLSPTVVTPTKCANSLTDAVADDGQVSSGNGTDDDYDEIAKLFETKSSAIEKWLRERASQDVVAKVHAATECARAPRSPNLRTSSVTSDLFQQWLASSPVQVSVQMNFTYKLSDSFLLPSSVKSKLIDDDSWTANEIKTIGEKRKKTAKQINCTCRYC